MAELKKLNKQSKVSVKLSEEKKREAFGLKYAIFNLAWAGICFVLILFIAGLAPTRECLAN